VLRYILVVLGLHLPRSDRLLVAGEGERPSANPLLSQALREWEARVGKADSGLESATRSGESWLTPSPSRAWGAHIHR
jgi:hypothetical protein